VDTFKDKNEDEEKSTAVNNSFLALLRSHGNLGDTNDFLVISCQQEIQILIADNVLNGRIVTS
jgi:hypothetical protein